MRVSVSSTPGRAGDIDEGIAVTVDLRASRGRPSAGARGGIRT